MARLIARNSSIFMKTCCSFEPRHEISNNVVRATTGSLTLICFLYLYTLYVVEGRTVTPLLHNCFWVNYTVIIQVTILCVYHLNKQLHALSSALYQKFATFTVLLSFCFFCEIWFYSCDGCTAIFVVLCSYHTRETWHRSECVLSFDWSRWWEHSVIIY